MPLKGKEYLEAQKNRPDQEYKIYTRYFDWITPNLIILFKKKQFEIVTVINMNEGNEILEIHAIEYIKPKQNDSKTVIDNGYAC
jgi:SPP1 family predicted phage head-tail adaptor